MTFNKKYSYLFLLAILLTLAACEETKYDITTYDGENFFKFVGSDVVAFESETNALEIPVTFSTGDKSSGTVDFQITGGTAGTDYELLNSSTSLTLNEGNSYRDVIRIQPIDNPDNDQDVLLDIVLSNPQSGVIGFPGPGNSNTAAFKVTILNVCPSTPIDGEYTSLSTGKSTDSCCPDEVVDLASAVSLTANSDGTYTISDFSAGMYFKWYAVYGIPEDLTLPAVITLADNKITVAGVGPFNSEITGEGIVNPCTGIVTYTWINGFNDTATVTLSPK